MNLRFIFNNHLKLVKSFAKPFISSHNSTTVVDSEFLYSTLFHHNKNFAPLILANFENIDFDKVRNSSELRGLAVPIDDLKNLVVKFESVKSEIKKINDERLKLAEMFREGDTSHLEQAMDFRNKLKLLNDERDKINNELMLKMLALPNEMNHVVNEDWNKLVIEYRENEGLHKILLTMKQSLNKSFGGINLRFIDDPLSTKKYLIMEHSYDWWLSQGYIAITLSDLSKTASVEACNDGITGKQMALNNAKPFDDGVINPQNIVFLRGSTSLEAFCSYLLRTITANKSLPARLVTMGNRYTNDEQYIDHQRSISVLIATASPNDMEHELTQLLSHLKSYWLKNFNLSLIGSSLPNENLNKYECHRYLLRSVEYSCNTMAHVSVIGDYLSRRLMIHSIDETPLYLLYAEVLNIDVLCQSAENNRNPVVFSHNSCWD